MIDVLLPTKGENIVGLRSQIQAVLNQTYRDFKLFVLMDGYKGNHAFCHLMDDCKSNKNIDFIFVSEEALGNNGHKAIQWALKNVKLTGEWIYILSDDDSVMPWALEALIGSSEGVDMVVGQAIRINREACSIIDVLGQKLVCGQITGSCCIYRAELMKKLGYDAETYESDWVMIDKMQKAGRTQLIDKLVYVWRGQ